MAKLTNRNISKAIRTEFHALTEFNVYRSPAGYFYGGGKVRDASGAEHIFEVESEYTFSLAQRTFAQWVDLWAGRVEKAMAELLNADGTVRS